MIVTVLKSHDYRGSITQGSVLSLYQSHISQSNKHDVQFCQSEFRLSVGKQMELSH